MRSISRLISCCVLLLFAAATACAESPIVVTAVGDIMMGTTWPEPILPPDDGRHVFANIKSALSGSDILFGNLEGTLFDGEGTPKCRKISSTCFAFRTPTSYVGHLKDAGFNALNIANNHALDFGMEAVESTLGALRGAGIQPVGGESIAYFTVKGKKVAILGYGFYPSSCSLSLLDIESARSTVHRMKKMNDLVIVSFHGGAEGSAAVHVIDEEEIFLGENRGNTLGFARAVVDAGADLVLGHGPHVLRAMEVYKGKLIAYSLGNFVGYRMFNIKGPNGISAALKVRLDPATGNFAGGEIVPVRLAEGGIPQPDPAAEAIGILRLLSAEDIPDAGLLYADNGAMAVRPPLTPQVLPATIAAEDSVDLSFLPGR